MRKKKFVFSVKGFTFVSTFLVQTRLDLICLMALVEKFNGYFNIDVLFYGFISLSLMDLML